jgi:trigger factor
VKSTVEKLSPTRVRINVEVPFAELQPDFDRAYKRLAKQIRLPGFRPGKAPAKLLEARLGRGAVLEQVVNDALPSRYSQAVTTSEVHPLGQPDIEVTKIEDGDELVFTAEVDIRPEIELPDLKALRITVDPIEVADEDVEAELQNLRARFGTLLGVSRPVQSGDFVSIDLSAAINGQDIPDAATEGLSHEVGSGRLIEGLDDAIIGVSEGESKVFTTTLVAGEFAGQEAEVTVTVQSVKERELPAADDEFAQLASEFDTIAELRSNLEEQVRRVKRIHQAEKIRDNALELLLEQIEVPLPESIVQAQIDEATKNALSSHENDEAKFAAALEAQDSSREKFDADTREGAEKAIKTQLLMDAIADHLEIKVNESDLTERLVLMARQYGIQPQQLAQILQQNNQLPAVHADVRRGLTVAAVVEAATVADTIGNVIDTAEFFGTGESAKAPDAEAEVADVVADEVVVDSAEETAAPAGDSAEEAAAPAGDSAENKTESAE